VRRALVFRLTLRSLLGVLTAVFVATVSPAPVGAVVAGLFVFLGALLAVELVDGIGRAQGGGTASAFERALAARRPASKRPEDLTRIEDRVALATAAASDVYVHLRPILREAAAHRLHARHGVDLDRNGDRARSLLGAEAWELVRPDLQPPSDRFGPGISPARLARVLDAVEAL